MSRLIYISHPAVEVRPEVPVPRWGLSASGAHLMRDFARHETVAKVTTIRASDETKATQAAQILADHLGLPYSTDPELGENDRSATGYLPPAEFEATADAFFANPDRSIRGWERAVDAQARVVKATKRALADHGSGDLALVGHGAVGTLLWLALSGLPVSRSADQPSPGSYWTASLPDLAPEAAWRPLSA